MIRALVADDSETARALLSGILSADPGIEVVGEAKDGLEALALARRLRPDVITMDIQMPGLSGFEATERMIRESPIPIVIVSGLDVRDVAYSLEALRAGALALLPKPGSPGTGTFAEQSGHFVATVKAMAQVRLVRRRAEPQKQKVPPLAPPARPRRAVRPRAVGMVASTGGPAALHRILGALPADFPLPILVVQHIAIGFSEGLASWLDSASPLSVQVARDGEPLRPGRVYVAPDNRHLGIGPDRRILLSDAPPVAGFRPSGTFLFETMARVFGPASLGVVLTGMGRDGADGLRLVRQAGGTVLAQDEATSDVFGMPAEVIREGIADHVLPLHSIATQLTNLV